MPRPLRFRCLLLVSVLVLVCSLEAEADEFRVVPSLAVREEYNDNVFFSSEREESDFVTTVSPALEVVEKTERLDVSVQARLDGRMYAENEDLNTLNQYYRLRLGHQVTPNLSVAAEGNYLRDSQPDRDVEETGLVYGTKTRERQYYSLSTKYAVSETTAAGLSYTFQQDEFHSSQDVDTQGHTVTLAITRDLREFFERTTARMNVGYSTYDFSDSRIDNYTWTVGAERKVHELWSVIVDGGLRLTRSEFEVTRLEPAGPGLARVVTEDENEKSLGGVGQAVLSYTGELARGSLTAYRDLRFAGGTTGATERTGVVLDLSRKFTYELQGGLSASYFRNKADPDEFAATEKIDDRTVNFAPRLRYDLSRNLAVEASYTYTRIEDRVDDDHAERNLVFIRVIFEYPMFE